jgi:hypothetical protein
MNMINLIMGFHWLLFLINIQCLVLPNGLNQEND